MCIELPNLKPRWEPGVGFSTLQSNVTPDSPNANWLFFQLEDEPVQMAKRVNQYILTGHKKLSEPGFDPGT